MNMNIVVLGNGAWGNALAALAREAGHQVTIWSRRNPQSDAVATADGLIVAIPAQAVGEVLTVLPSMPATTPLLITAKGIENTSGQFMHQVAQRSHPENPILLLSGPSFAEDVVRNLPTAVALAAGDIAVAARWAGLLSRPHFRIYTTDDMTGVAVGGSFKNVLAIAAGIVDGHGLGESAKAAMIARGFSELLRLGRACGARPETLMGLSGLGDLLLTCSSLKSRNYSLGRMLGQGMTVEQALSASKGVVEGVLSAPAALAIAHRHAIEMPIVAAVSAVLGSSSPKAEIDKLLARPIGREFT